eukprot:14616476-Alexandrium_andersonii.AAC.1
MRRRPKAASSCLSEQPDACLTPKAEVRSRAPKSQTADATAQARPRDRAARSTARNRSPYRPSSR